jgi:hypothetical protein
MNTQFMYYLHTHIMHTHPHTHAHTHALVHMHIPPQAEFKLLGFLFTIIAMLMILAGYESDLGEIHLDTASRRLKTSGASAAEAEESGVMSMAALSELSRISGTAPLVWLMLALSIYFSATAFTDALLMPFEQLSVFVLRFACMCMHVHAWACMDMCMCTPHAI